MSILVVRLWKQQSTYHFRARRFLWVVWGRALFTPNVVAAGGQRPICRQNCNCSSRNWRRKGRWGWRGQYYSLPVKRTSWEAM